MFEHRGFRRYEPDWSIRVMRYSHPQIPTQTSESASTSYLHVEFLCRTSFVLGFINARDLVAVGTMLASLSVRTTTGLSVCRGETSEILACWTLGESHALLFLAVLVAEADVTHM